MLKKITKILFCLPTLTAILVNPLWSIPAEAFTVDVSRLYYYDWAGTPEGSPRTVNYSFSSGSISGNTISIPDSAVQKPPPDAGLTYTFGPYPDPNNAITLQLNTGSCTMSTSTDGGAIINTSAVTGTAPQVEWTFEVKLQNFTGITESGKSYTAQIGMGSTTPGPQPELSAMWQSNGTLQLYGQIYDSTGNGTSIWRSSIVTLSGQNIANTVIEFRVSRPAPPNAYYLTFEYRLNSGTWTGLDSYTIPEAQRPTNFLSFPSLFPYISLRVEQPQDPFQVYSIHQNNINGNKYYASLFVTDPGQVTYQSISVVGSGCVNVASTALTYNTLYSNGSWNLLPSWSVEVSQNTPPSCTQAFDFTAVKKAGGTDTVHREITGYVQAFAAKLSPTGNVSGTPIFSWAGIAGASGYTVEVNDLSYNRIWNYYGIGTTQNSVTYAGPALNSGQTYLYNIVSVINTANAGNISITESQFTYTGVNPANVSYGSGVRTATGSTPVAGASVSLVGIPSTNTTTDAMGMFNLGNILAGLPFSIQISKTNYITVYSSNIPSNNGDVLGRRSYVMFTDADVGAGLWSAWINRDTTGTILGSVFDTTSVPMNPVAGAVITATNAANSAITYPVTYMSGASTAYDGMFYIFNVPDGVTVNVSVSMSGFTWSYSTAAVQAHVGAISEESFFGATANPTIAFTANVTASNGTTAISGATVEQVGASPTNSTTTDASGYFTLTNLPKGSSFYLKFSKDTYQPTYSLDQNSTNNLTSMRPFRLYTQSEMSGWGVTTGKGVIRARITDLSGNTLSGVYALVVSSVLGRTYQVKYCDDSGSCRSTDGTYGNGIFMVMDVEAGDVVIVTAQKSGLSFGQRVFHTFANSVTQGGIGQASGSWQTKTPMPTARSAPAAGVVNGLMYVVGGSYQTTYGLSTNEAYDPAGNTWATKASMPTARNFRGANAAVVNGILYFVGGNIPGYCTSAVEAYDPAANTWSTKAPMPTERCHLAVAVLNGIIYAIGGTNTSGDIKYQTVEAYDPATNTWSTKASMPTGRQDLAVGVANGLIYAIGGWNPGLTPSHLSTVEAYNPATNTWSTKASMPTGRSGLAAGVMNNIIYAVGGYDGASYFATVETYNPVDNTWNPGVSMPAARAYMTAAVAGGILYVAGGGDMNSQGGSNTLFAYTPPPISSFIVVSGKVLDWNGAVIPSAVTVSMAGNTTTATTSSPTDGSFTLPGIPANTAFSLKFSQTGFVDLYTTDINSASDLNISATAFIYLPTASDLSAIGVAPIAGKGVITGQVVDNTYHQSSTVGGAVVTAASALHPAIPYAVTYQDPFGVVSGTATYGNGRYYILNVDDGDTVTVTASKSGWTFRLSPFHAHANAVHQGKVFGASPGYDASMSGSVREWVSGAVIPVSAHIELKGDPGKSTDSNVADGSYTFAALPRDATFYSKATAAGYVTTYAGPSSLGGNITGINIPMLTSAEMTGFGVTAGNGLIAGVVVDQAMNRRSGATVSVSSKLGQTYTVMYDGSTNATAASGKFHVPNIIPGDVVKIDVTLTGYAFPSTYLNSFAPAVTAKYIRGSSSGNVSGALTYSGSQAGNFRVKIWSADMMSNYSTEISVPAAGPFSFTYVPNGRYYIGAYRDSNSNGQYTAGEAYGYYQDGTGPNKIEVNGINVTVGNIILADPAGTSTGASVSINSAIAGVRGYLAFFRQGESIRNAINNGGSPVFGLDIDLLTGQNNYNALSMGDNFGAPVPAGTYDFYFMTGDLDRGPDKGVFQYAQAGVVVNKGALTAVPAFGSIAFNAGGTVSGTVTSNTTGHPLWNVQVYLVVVPDPINHPENYTIAAWGKTDSSGNFQFDHVPVGNYYLNLVYNGYTAYSPIPVNISSNGQTVPISATSTKLIPVQPPGMITGGLTPYASVESRIYLKSADTIVAKVTPSTTNGSYTITDVVAGTYTLVGSARGYIPQQVSVTVTSGQTVTQDFTLNSPKSVVINGLNWLLAHQRADGSFDDNLAGNPDQYVFGWTGYTGLTLLSIYNNPTYSTSVSPDYIGDAMKTQIYDALYGNAGKIGLKQYFESTYNATDDPSTGWNDVGAFYNSTVSWAPVAATPVALEKLVALGMPLNDAKTVGAVNFLLGAQITAAKASDPIFAGGWRYNPFNTDTDNWETAWVIMALMKAGVNPSVQAVFDGLNHIKRSQITSGGGAGMFRYQPNDTSGYGPLGTSAACVLAMNFAGEPVTEEHVARFFQWAKDNGDFRGFSRYADAYWWSMFPWAAILYDDPATSSPVKKYYDTLELTWNMADDVILRQNTDGSWSNPNFISGGSNSGNSVMYTASALMAIAPYAGLTPRPAEVPITGTIQKPSGDPLQNAKVEALLDGIVRASAITNAQGAYTLSVPKNYSYDIRVTATGYVRKSLTTANVGEVGLTNQNIAYTGADIDTVAPTISNLTPPNGQETTLPYQGIVAVLSDDNSGIDPSTIVFRLDGAAVGATYNPANSQVQYVPSPWLLAGLHNVTVDVKDYAGNSADQAAWSFRLISRLKGDVNNDAAVNLADIILTLQVISGMNPAGIRADYATSGVDVNGDNRIGLGEVQFNLQRVSGVRLYESGAGITLSTTGHPPAFFSFSGGRTNSANSDFTVTNYSGSQAPYSAYGWVNSSYGIIDLGTVSLNSVTEVSATGYVIPQSMNLTQGHSYAFKLGDGTYAVLEVKSVTPIAPQGITMVFDYKYQPNGSRSF